MEAKKTMINNIAVTITLMAMVITANSLQDPYSVCIRKCADECLSKSLDGKCLINCDLKCHGSAVQQFSKDCKDSCLQMQCSKFSQGKIRTPFKWTDGIKKLICESGCKMFCHAWD